MPRLQAQRHHNLPAPRVRLIGRDQDLAAVQEMVLDAAGRLVTLTGTGGCGKTQLALLVATSLIDSFADGVWLVDLAPVQAPQLVPQAVMSALGVREQPSEAPSQTLAGWLGGRCMLVVLDNCEHLLDACASLAASLLDACSNLRLLTTSREPLRISGERVWRVPSLGIPGDSMLLPEQVTHFASLQLFGERAQAVQSDFTVTPSSAGVVAAICTRLGGLPLAIELAAAWVRVLGVDQILARLDDAFELLVGGSRAAPTRQQTMRATMDWSHSLLTDAERLVFRRLAVFVSGWTLEAAEQVCSAGPVERREVLTHMRRLVDASLVQLEEHDEQARYVLLEPVRQYAHLCLRASGELDATRRQHAAFFLSYAERWETDANSGGPGRETAFIALESEQENLRTALRWYLEQGEAENGIRVAKTLWTFWVVRALYTEGRSWLSRLAALPDAGKVPAMRAVAQGIEASLAWRQADYDVALALFRAVLPHLDDARVHEPRLRHAVYHDLGNIALYQADAPGARMHLEEALASARAAGSRVDEALAVHALGWLALMEEDYLTARTLCEESQALARAVGDSWALCNSLTTLARIVLRQGDISAARAYVEESLSLARRMGEQWLLPVGLDVLGRVAIANHQYAEAGAALREGLFLRRDQGSRSGIADSLENIAALAAAQTEARCAIQLLGAAANIREAVGERLTPVGRTMIDEWLLPVRQGLGTDAFQWALDAGRAMSMEAVLELASAVTQTPESPRNGPADESKRVLTHLTPREQQVAALLAQGLTNRQIAQRLVVTQRTVATHIEHILDKLGFASRHQAGVWAAEHGLQAGMATEHGRRSDVRGSHRQTADLS